MSGHFQSGHHVSGHFASGHFGRLAIIPPDPEPEVIHPMGSDLARRKWILRDDDELVIALITAFLETKD